MPTSVRILTFDEDRRCGLSVHPAYHAEVVENPALAVIVLEHDSMGMFWQGLNREQTEQVRDALTGLLEE